MGILNYNDITPKRFILHEGAPYEVLSSHVFRKQMRKPVNQTKLRNVITGKVTEYSFHQAETVPEADLSERPLKFLYHNRGEYWFCDAQDPSQRFPLGETVLSSPQFLKQNSLVNALVFDDAIIGVKLPVKVDLLVTEAPPGTRGNTAQGGTKQVTLETGASLSGVPLFINEGDIVRVNTETGTYVERVEKK